MPRIVIALLLGSWAFQAAKPPKPGVKTPGVKIPIERLKPDAVFPYPGTPDWLAIDEAAWVSNAPKDSVAKMDPKTNTIVNTVTVGVSPRGLAYDPTNHNVYAANFGSFQSPGDTVSVISTK